MTTKTNKTTNNKTKKQLLKQGHWIKDKSKGDINEKYANTEIYTRITPPFNEQEFLVKLPPYTYNHQIKVNGRILTITLKDEGGWKLFGNYIERRNLGLHWKQALENAIPYTHWSESPNKQKIWHINEMKEYDVTKRIASILCNTSNTSNTSNT